MDRRAGANDTGPLCARHPAQYMAGSCGMTCAGSEDLNDANVAETRIKSMENGPILGDRDSTNAADKELTPDVLHHTSLHGAHS